MKHLLLLIPLSLASPPLIQINGPLPPVDEVMGALQSEGALIFTGLGEEYSAALESLSRRAPYCLEGLGLTVEMDDGSERLTVARDTVGATGPFPDCVRLEADVVRDAFDRVDKVFSQLMRQQFGNDLDVVEEERNVTKVWEEFDSKTHLHVYRRSNKVTTAPLALPYHTDNGMYVLLTPSSILPLRTIDRRGEVNLLDSGSSSVILILGTGVTSWLMPESGLYAAPHGLPALATILTPAPRTVMARMRVAPPGSLPSSSTHSSSELFWTHFSAPLETETGSTLRRLIRQRRQAGDQVFSKSDCSQDWPHACSHTGGCRVPRTELKWRNGQIGERQNVDEDGCKNACENTLDCAAWTHNTKNGWCGLKAKDQIKKGANGGFVSGMIDRNSP